MQLRFAFVNMPFYLRLWVVAPEYLEAYERLIIHRHSI
jgi:hypothetical protein